MDETGAPGRRVEGAAGQRGSVLMLMPAAILIVIVLGAIAVDLSLVHLAERQLQSAVDDAANDATAALREDAYRAGGGYSIDPGRAMELVQQSLEGGDLPGALVGPTRVRVTGDRIEVSATVEVDYLFADVVPGHPGSTTVTVDVRAYVTP